MPRACVRRLDRELREWRKDRGIQAGPLVDDNILEWQAAITGPEDSLYEGGTFYFKIKFPEQYPLKAPKIIRLTPMIHVNSAREECHMCLPQPVGTVGHCSLEEASWRPATKLCDILLAIRHVLKHPNFEDPADSDLAALYQRNKEDYAKRVREHVIKHAMNDCPRLVNI